MTLNKIKEKISELTETPLTQISDNTDIFSIGVNSINSVNLIVELEEMFGIMIMEEDLHPDNFETPIKIAELVERSPKF